MSEYTHYPDFRGRRNTFHVKHIEDCCFPDCLVEATTGCASKLCNKKFCSIHSLHDHLRCYYGNCDLLAVNYQGVGGLRVCIKHHGEDDAWRSSTGWRITVGPSRL
jgi:hypothetical protein